MGTVITGRETVVFYGYLFGDEYHGNYPDTEAVAKANVAESGRPDPYDSFPEGADHRAWSAEHKAEIEAYLAAWLIAEADLPVCSGTHGSDAAPTPYLYMTGTRRDTPRGTAKASPSMDPIPIIGADADPEWKTTFDTFLQAQGITPPTGDNQPGWWSAAYEDRN